MLLKWTGRMLAFFLLVCFGLSGCSAEGLKTTGYIPVTHVVDGDTIDVKLNGEEETVRLLLVDTPETVHPQKPIQPFGPKAHRFMVELLKGEKVKLEIGEDPRGKYDRLLAYVYTEDGEMVNELLLRKGLARVAYVYPPDTKYVEEFRAIEEKARKNNRGIWSIEGYVTDHGFERTEQCRIKGNINSDGEHIYHVPGDPYYEETKAEAYFCTKKAAQAAGFRAPHY
ncbi:MAG TPA: thermonuclease family protein [Bacillales bacterium]